MTPRIVARALAAATASLTAVVFFAGAALANPLAPDVKRLKIENPTRLLFVGNSYLYYGDSVHNHVRRMAAAAGLRPEADLKYKSATIGGAALFDHNIDSYLEPGKLRVKDSFQVVILQGGSAVGWSKTRPAEFKATVVAFAQKIAAAGGETALYMTHAYVAPNERADPNMTATLERIYVDAGNTTGALVIPVGLAFQKAYALKPEIRLHKASDGSHPSLLGTYLAASVVFASIYGVSPVGNAYDYFGEIPKDDAAFLQQVAEDTVRNFYSR